MSVVDRICAVGRVLLAQDDQITSVSKLLPAGDYRAERVEMIREHLITRGVDDYLVLSAMLRVPRHKFMPPEVLEDAYSDYPLPVWEGQTISQPYIVGLTTQCARVRSGMKVLDIGTGTGYQAAVLASMGAQVYSVEVNEVLARTAKERLYCLGYNVEVRQGDGCLGWPEQSPFGAIIAAASSPRIPNFLLQQLSVGGRMVIPIGLLNDAQNLVVVEKTINGVELTVVESVRFVPMLGVAQKTALTTIQ